MTMYSLDVLLYLFGTNLCKSGMHPDLVNKSSI